MIEISVGLFFTDNDWGIEAEHDYDTCNSINGQIYAQMMGWA